MIKIIDNSIPVFQQDYIQDLISSVEPLENNDETEKTFGLSFCGNISTGLPPFRKTEMGFGKTFFRNNILNKDSSALMFPLYHVLSSKNIVLKKIFEARVFMLMPNGDDTFIQQPHRDKWFDHHSLLYYVYGTDGDTVFYDKGLTPNQYNNQDQNAIEDLKKNHIKKRISPKKGRSILFSGENWHSGSTPTKDVRIVLNYNFKI